ncbi:P-loop containing nucleoside triphosphate hydrolase protein [Powellomyces hirtus]|nr:P-loop containing nucleoside triphosphate hydrolase protein [Powellomyces hirtus]
MALPVRLSSFQTYSDVFLRRLPDADLRVNQRECLDWLRGQNVMLPEGPGLFGVVSPPGSGKSGLLVSTPYVLGSRRTMILSPRPVINTQILNAFGEGPGVTREDSFLVKRGIFTLQEVVTNGIIPTAYQVNRRIDLNDKISGADLMVVNTHKFGAGPWVQNLPDNSFDLVLVDEAHHYPSTTWLQIITWCRERGAKVIFFTASPYRFDQNEVLPRDAPQYHFTISRALEEGIIRQVDIIRFPSAADTTMGVNGANAEEVLHLNTLAKMNQLLAQQEEGHALSTGPHLGMIAVPSQAVADRFIELQARHAATFPVKCFKHHTGESETQREANKESFEGPNRGIMVVVGSLMEGYDNPRVSVVCPLVTTQSKNKYYQFFGRGLRRVDANDDAHCLVMIHEEHAGLIALHEAVLKEDFGIPDPEYDREEEGS